MAQNAASQVIVPDCLLACACLTTLSFRLTLAHESHGTHSLLTEAGKHYIDGCRAILEELYRLDASVSTEEREATGVLRILATDSLSPQVMTALIDGFRRRTRRCMSGLPSQTGERTGLKKSMTQACSLPVHR